MATSVQHRAQQIVADYRPIDIAHQNEHLKMSWGRRTQPRDAYIEPSQRWVALGLLHSLRTTRGSQILLHEPRSRCSSTLM